MNIVEELLKIDNEKLKMPTKDVTLKLGKLGGKKFTFTCKAIDQEKFSEIQENTFNVSKQGAVKGTNLALITVLTLTEGCEAFKSKELMEHFKAPTPKELINKLLLPGEAEDLFKAINDLNNFTKEDEEEIKN